MTLDQPAPLPCRLARGARARATTSLAACNRACICDDRARARPGRRRVRVPGERARPQRLTHDSIDSRLPEEHSVRHSLRNRPTARWVWLLVACGLWRASAHKDNTSLRRETERWCSTIPAPMSAEGRRAALETQQQQQQATLAALAEPSRHELAASSVLGDASYRRNGGALAGAALQTQEVGLDGLADAMQRQQKILAQALGALAANS
eukprot:COSAG02_NODE_4544_length_5228_cov_8.569117_9_plen_208_part_01